ncbi:glucokinase [Rhizobiaceae bacterium n13]|uniref:Glucokinase n=1 Tax=Ferirhizobium litorale TaxID=2927786 RepID=A0AAE3QHI5_9HYPH|nr:glucokinase [Fererhizobium litorale]MDI7862907.1 glucokinase [Fererhizobium litorale]MDI7923993.1 glucokinase [Fererhizobium litorale]
MPRNFDNDPPLPFPILIGDIGGTNARFSILVDVYAEPREFPIVQTAAFKTIDDAIQQSVLDKTSIQPRSAILAIAGPINGDEIPLTNCHWVVRPRHMIANLGLEDVLVVNDFEAQALAIASLADEHREQIGSAADTLLASRVVLGPGTGLGVAGLVHAQHTWFPVPGEGGHVDIGPRTERDFEIFPHLDKIEDRVSAEEVLSGRGLLNIYHAVCKADGKKPKLKTPADVSTAALSGDDDLAVEAVSLFATYLGRVAGDVALIFMARGGVYLSGGISQKIIPALHKPEFRAAFEDKAPHTQLMRSIPTYVVTHPLAALAGLAAYARTPSSFGLATEGRRWRH